MASLRAVLVLAVAVAAASSVAADDPDYSYVPGTKLGPDNWSKLSPKYSACNGGPAVRKQSPIDIVTKNAVPKADLDSLNRTYVASNATLINNGKEISMTFAGKPGTVSIGGKAFSLKKLQWRTPSEHTINGKRHPLELQLIHQSDAGTGEVAILAIIYKVGAPDSFYFQLKRKLAELAADRCSYGEQDARVAAGLVHLRSLEKRTGSYFRYMGSLTAPPCAENVYWNVLGKVRQLTQEQLDLLVAPLPAAAKQNARPVQPINGRVITFYNPPNSTISFEI
ncbi:hypothetical protein ZWY2020_052593 [Hordeum vulgare]|nr:hypothetical protein ZWY2020_052593 [Hordeum vulgare]